MEQIDEPGAVGRVPPSLRTVEADRVDRARGRGRGRNARHQPERRLLQRVREIDAGVAGGRELGQSRGQALDRSAQRGGFALEADSFETGAMQFGRARVAEGIAEYGEPDRAQLIPAAPK